MGDNASPVETLVALCVEALDRRELRDPHDASSEVLRLAERRGCLPLLAFAAHGAGKELPPAASERLHTAERRAWATYEATAETIAPVLHRASEEGLCVLVYKGASVAARMYPEPWLRPMADVDVLVSSQDAGPFVHLLEEAGFLETRSPGRERTAAISHERSFRSPRRGVREVDVHTAPAAPARYPLDVAALFRRSVQGRLFDSPVRFPATGDEIVLAAVHHAHVHFRVETIRLLDGHLLSAACSDWSGLVDLARRASAAAACWVLLSALRHTTGARIPEATLRALEPPAARRVWLQALLQTGADGSPRYAFPRRVEQLLLTYPLVDDPRRAAAYVTRHGWFRLLDYLG